MLGTTDGYHVLIWHPWPCVKLPASVVACEIRVADNRRQYVLNHCNVPSPGGSLRDEIFFCLLRTALKDRPKGPPTANRQLPSTANRHQPPTTNRHQPPATNRCQPPAATNRQLPTTANRLQPPTASHQPPPTTPNRQLPTANRQPPPTANRQLPPTMVEHMECPRAFLGKLVLEHFFFFPVKDTPARPKSYKSLTSTAFHPTLLEWLVAGGGGGLPVRPDPPPPLWTPQPILVSTRLELATWAPMAPGKFVEPGKFAAHLICPPLVYIQNAHNELGNAVPRAFFCWPGCVC